MMAATKVARAYEMTDAMPITITVATIVVQLQGKLQ